MARIDHENDLEIHLKRNFPIEGGSKNENHINCLMRTGLRLYGRKYGGGANWL